MNARHEDIMRLNRFTKQQVQEATQKLTDETLQHYGQMTLFAMEGLLGFLAQLGDRQPAINDQTDDEEMKSLTAKQEELNEQIKVLENKVELLQRGMERSERLLATHVQQHTPVVMPTASRFQFGPESEEASPEPQKASGRLSREEIRERCLRARLQLEQQGQVPVKASEIVAIAGVKYHQFSYVFKKHELFEQAFQQWRQETSDVA